jgi:hypothetical protein
MVRKVQYGDYGTLNFPDEYTDDQIKEYIDDNYKVIENRLNVPIRENVLEDSFAEAIIPGQNIELGFRKFQKSLELGLADFGLRDQEEAAYNTRMYEKRIQNLQDQIVRDNPEQFKALVEASEAETFGEAAKIIASKPTALIPLILQSLGTYVPALGVTAATAVTTRGLGAGPFLSTLLNAGSLGSASFATEYNMSFTDSFEESGVDVNDPLEVVNALNDESILGEAREKGLDRGIPIGIFDALAFGAAGQILRMTKNAGKTGLGAKLAASTGEIGVAGSLGAMGEAVAQVSSEGSITKPGEVLLEGIAEGPTGLIEAGINALQKNEKVIDEAKDKGQEPAKIDEEEKTPNETTFGNLTKPETDILDDAEPDQIERGKKAKQLKKQLTATGIQEIYNVISNQGAGVINKKKIRKQLERPLAKYLENNTDVENAIYDALIQDNKLTQEGKRLLIPSADDSRTIRNLAKQKKERIKKQQKIEKLQQQVVQPKVYGQPKQGVIDKKLTSQKNPIARSLKNKKDRDSFKEGFNEGAQSTTQEFRDNKNKRVGKVTTFKSPKQTGFIGTAIPAGLSEQVLQETGKPFYVAEPTNQPAKAFTSMEQAQDYLRDTANTKPGQKKKLEQLKEAMNTVPETRETINPTPVSLGMDVDSTASSINQKVRNQRSSNRKKYTQTTTLNPLTSPEANTNTTPEQAETAMENEVAQDETVREVDKNLESIDRQIDPSDKRTKKDQEAEEKKLKKSAEALGSLKDSAGMGFRGWVSSLYDRASKSNVLGKLAEIIIGKDELRAITYEKLSKIILPFYNLPKPSKVKIAKAIAYARVTQMDTSNPNKIQNITAQDLQISNRDKPIFKPNDPVLKEGIQLSEDEMIGVKAVQAMANFERNQVILESVRNFIENVQDAPPNLRGLIDKAILDLNVNLGPATQPQPFGAGVNGRQFNSDIGSRLKKLAKDIQEKNDNQDTPESILAFTTGDRIEKLDAYFDMYYLPTSRTGDKFVAATQYVKMKDKQGRDLKDKLGRQKYKQETIYWDGFETKASMFNTKSRAEKRRAEQTVKDLREQYKDLINTKLPTNAVDSQGNKIKEGTSVVTVTGIQDNTFNQVRKVATSQFETSLDRFLSILPQDYFSQTSYMSPDTDLLPTEARIKEIQQAAKAKGETISKMVAKARALRESKGVPTFLRAANFVPGYDFNNVDDSIAKHLHTYSSWNSGFVFDSRLNEAFDDVEKDGSQGEQQYAEKLREYLSSDPYEFGLVRQAAFMWYLTDVSAASMNLFQSIPAAVFNGTYGGTLKAGKEMIKALKDTGKALKNPLKGIKTDTQIDFDKLPSAFPDIPAFQNPEELIGTVVSPGRVNEYLNRESDNIISGEKVTRRFSFQKATRILGFLFTTTESINRLAAYASSYRLTKDPKALRKAVKILQNNKLFNARVETAFKTDPEGLRNMLDDLTDTQNAELRNIIARMAVEETQFLYGRAVKPRMVRNWGSWIFQFTEYPTMMLELMARLGNLYGRDGQKALGLYALALIGTSGFLGLPLLEDIKDFTERSYNRVSKEKISLDQIYYDLMSDIGANPKLAEILQNGTFRAMNLDIGPRVGLGSHPISAAFIDILYRDAGFNKFTPPALSIGQGIADSFSFASINDPRMYTAFAPKFIKSIHEGVLLDTQGYRTKFGKTIMVPEDVKVFEDQPSIDKFDALLKGLGFTSADIAREREVAFLMKIGKEENAALKRSFYGRLKKADGDLARAYSDKNLTKEQRQRAIKRALEDIEDIEFDRREYNAKVLRDNEGHKQIILQETTREKNRRNEIEGGGDGLLSGLPQDEQFPTKERIKALPRAK